MVYCVSSPSPVWPFIGFELRRDNDTCLRKTNKLVAAAEGHTAPVDLEPSYSFQIHSGSIMLEIETPGVKKQDLSIELMGQKLTVTGKTFVATDDERAHKSAQGIESSHDDVATDKNGKPKKQSERVAKCVYRKIFALPAKCDLDAVLANYEDGVLRLTIPLREVERRAIQINV